MEEPVQEPEKKLDDKTVTISLPMILVDRLAIVARKQRRKLSAVMDYWIETYLTTHKLEPMPEGARLKRQVAGGGESKLRRYILSPETIAMLKEAEDLGYSRSYIVEEAVKEGLANA